MKRENRNAAQPPEPLTPRQIKLICILAENPNIKSATESMKVAYKDLYSKFTPLQIWETAGFRLNGTSRNTMEQIFIFAGRPPF